LQACKPKHFFTMENLVEFVFELAWIGFVC